MIDSLQEVDQGFGITDAVVVFNAQEDAAFAGVIAAFPQARDGLFVGFGAFHTFGLAASKYADVRCAEHGGMVYPFLQIGNLYIARVSFG